MFVTLDAFFRGWKHESEGTLKIMRALTDASLAQPVSPEDRSLGRIAWHVVGSLVEMMNRTGLCVEGPAEDTPVPATAAVIAQSYETAMNSLAEQIRSRWDDASLAVTDDMYGETWPRGLTLSILIHHQAHHRGQMTVLMRQAGLKVPGVYGPAREEWAAYGAPPPAI